MESVAPPPPQRIHFAAGAEPREALLWLPAKAWGVAVLPTVGARRHPEPHHVDLREGLLGRGLGVATVELLTPWEETLDHFSGRLRYDVELLAQRLLELLESPSFSAAAPGLPRFAVAEGTLVAAAMLVAARRPRTLHALVSCSGRPDLVKAELAEVRAPALMVVDAEDAPVLELTVGALSRLGGPSELRILPSDSPPGGSQAARRVAELAADWLRQRLAGGSASFAA